MSIENLVRYFGAIEDPRCSGKVEHRLLDILIIAVSAVIAWAGSSAWWCLTASGRVGDNTAIQADARRELPQKGQETCPAGTTVRHMGDLTLAYRRLLTSPCLTPIGDLRGWRRRAVGHRVWWLALVGSPLGYSPWVCRGCIAASAKRLGALVGNWGDLVRVEPAGAV